MHSEFLKQKIWLTATSLFKVSLFVLFALFLSGLGKQAQAAQVLAVQGERVMIELGSSSLQEGDALVVQYQGRAIGGVRVMQIRGDRALGRLVRGEAVPGARLLTPAQARQGGAPSASPSPPSFDYTSAATSQRGSSALGGWGFLAGLSMNSMQVRQSPTQTASLAGTSFNAKGFYDFAFNRSFDIRFGAGLESLTAAGGNSCGNSGSSECDINVSYLGADATARYIFMPGNFGLWAGGGASFLFPMSVSSNAVDSEKVSLTSLIFLGFGADIALGSRSYIPVTFEYGIFPPSEDVQSSQMNLRVGYGFRF